eukprot:GHVT01071101.1.p1 GENE.GHVT01071101.1~~GHVT01071101.1.p1  ORF type:complete len:158 (-),score=25.46 GHVT01071101.1:36-509(-)
MQLGEAGQPCGNLGEQRSAVHVGLSDACELPTEGRQPWMQHRPHQGLKLGQDAAVRRGPHRADLDHLHLVAGQLVALVARRLQVDHEDGSHTIPASTPSSDCPALRSRCRACMPKARGPSTSQRLESPENMTSPGAQPSASHTRWKMAGSGLARPTS